MSLPQLNSQAPLFSAKDQYGNDHALLQYRGRWVLLYFYPKANTSDCTTEACNFRDNYLELQQYVLIIGVSKDSIPDQKNFAEKHLLPFPLLSDENQSIQNMYGAGGVFGSKRVTFLINPEGLIAKIYENVDVNTHAEQILQDLRALFNPQTAPMTSPPQAPPTTSAQG